MNVQVIRLKTGEDLIIDLVSKDINTGKIKVKDPFVMFMPSPGKLAMLPFLAYCNLDNGLEIQAEDVMWQLVPEKEVADQYTSMITGIVTPSTMTSASGRSNSLRISTT
jgi:hypothetical protein